MSELKKMFAKFLKTFHSRKLKFETIKYKTISSVLRLNISVYKKRSRFVQKYFSCMELFFLNVHKFLIISLFAKINVREIFEISRFAKINVREIQFFWSRENYCSRKLMTLRYVKKKVFQGINNIRIILTPVFNFRFVYNIPSFRKFIRTNSL